MDIKPKSESLSCTILFRENDLIRFKEENNFSTYEAETGKTVIKLQVNKLAIKQLLKQGCWRKIAAFLSETFQEIQPVSTNI